MPRILLAALALCMAAGAGAQNPLEPAPTPAAPPKAEPVQKKATAAKKPRPNVRPAWAELTAEQQKILSPLKADWDTLEPERRQKWLAIAKQYPRMKPEAQERVQRRMQAWARLTPEQRRQARENYKHLAKQPPQQGEKKSLREAWAEYQALPPSERQSLVPPPNPDSPAGGRRPKH